MINEPIPPRKKTTWLPLVVIITGIAFQLIAAGVIGIPTENLLMKTWPVLILAVGLDMLINQRRFLAAAVICFLGAALLFLYVKNDPRGWEIFMTFWPLLMILLGLDILFRGRSLGGIIVLIVVLLLALYLALSAKGIIQFKDLKLPSNLSILQHGIPVSQTPMALQGDAKTLDYPMPDASFATFQMNIPSGTLKVNGANLPNRVLTGKVKLGAGEQLNENQDSQQGAITYLLAGQAGAAKSSDAQWDFQLSQQMPLALQTMMESGYQMIDLRGLMLGNVSLMNREGNIDLMLPSLLKGTLTVSAQKGTIRVFVPTGVSAFMTVSAEANVIYPADYTRSGDQIFPSDVSESKGQIVINANIGEGTIKIIPSTN